MNLDNKIKLKCLTGRKLLQTFLLSNMVMILTTVEEQKQTANISTLYGSQLVVNDNNIHILLVDDYVIVTDTH